MDGSGGAATPWASGGGDGPRRPTSSRRPRGAGAAAATWPAGAGVVTAASPSSTSSTSRSASATTPGGRRRGGIRRRPDHDGRHDVRIGRRRRRLDRQRHLPGQHHLPGGRRRLAAERLSGYVSLVYGVSVQPTVTSVGPRSGPLFGRQPRHRPGCEPGGRHPGLLRLDPSQRRHGPLVHLPATSSSHRAPARWTSPWRPPRAPRP